MNFDIFDKISSKYKDYKFEKIKSGASKKIFYRIIKGSNSLICLDLSNENKEYKNFLNVHSYLSKVNVSIPNIYENDDVNNILILEDFGNLRFDKILKNYTLRNLLGYAVKTLIILKNDIDHNNFQDLPVYDYNTFKSEISEFYDFYYPYVHNKEISKDLIEEFYWCWEICFNSINFDFNNFVHKDFNINNLMYLSSRKEHLRCGLLDFQSAFWGDSCWDLFSLLEDSRIYFDDQFNDHFIKFFYKSTNQNIKINDFIEKYYVLNCSRQTRLLGRWVKLSKELNQSFYLGFIETTKKRLIKAIEKINRKNLKSIYNKLIPGLSNV
jgi:aminoglycoside/choline kinase family phosphotransferase|tara:strand:+ start:425 stop:1399 length:975 start_codon:yes stop_codon:yes gene_type:complete